MHPGRRHVLGIIGGDFVVILTLSSLAHSPLSPLHLIMLQLQRVAKPLARSTQLWNAARRYATAADSGRECRVWLGSVVLN